MYGYTGKLLSVDLSKKDITIIETPKEHVKSFIGGSGLAARLIYDMVSPDLDPLSPENTLFIMTGPMTGTSFPTSGRFAVCSKSPLTNGWGEATASGFWGPELKFSGFDGIVIKGRSDNPVYLFIQDGEPSLLSAEHLWGKDAYEVDETIRKDHGDPKIRVIAIGLAGENMVRFAGITVHSARMAARTGMGAIMGSKKLKAIAVRGSKKVEMADEGRFLRNLKQVHEVIKASPGAKRLRELGTPFLILTHEPLGNLPAKYWTLGEWPDGAEKISGERMKETILIGNAGCFMCPVACERIIEIREGPYAPLKGKGPEYETLGSLGSLLLIEDLEAISKANELCGRYGMDTISTGNVIGFSIYLYEKGILSDKDTDGVKLRWSDPELLLKLIKMIAEREGIGNLMAEGIKRMAEKLGAEDSAAHIRGLEFPMHDPRAFPSVGLSYATIPRGACHTAFTQSLERKVRVPELGFDKPIDRYNLEGKVHLVKTMQDYAGTFDSLTLCKFLIHSSVHPSLIAEGLAAITGWDVDTRWLLRVGERTFNLKRAYNYKCGTGTRKHDVLPKIILTPLKEGGARDYVPKLEPLLDEYYKARGWTEEGIPSYEKLKELDLGDIAEDIWRRG
jgi:aldehyde:ferredoxin oxidoreductase